MGAECFTQTAKGATAAVAFKAARDQALYDHGHNGYSGNIAEKTNYITIPLPSGKTAREYAQELIDTGDSRIDDKWGPAGCIDLGNNLWLFFGWASS